MKLILSGIFFSCFFCEAQHNQLQIGDTVPDVSFKIIRNYSSSSARLSDFKDKYIILDFWNIGCKSCIEAFPHLEEIQDTFREDLQIILVTNNSPNQVDSRSKTVTNIRMSRLPMVLSDTILTHHFFPHSAVPYQIWLDKNRIVKMKTSGTSATVANIKDLITNKFLTTPIWKEIDDPMLKEQVINAPRPIFWVGEGRFIPRLVYYSGIRDYQKKREITKLYNLHALNFDSVKNDVLPFDGVHSAIYSAIPEVLPVPWRAVLRDLYDNEIGLRYLNKPVFYLYQGAFNWEHHSKIIIEPGTNIEGPPCIYETEKGLYSKWYKKNQYCYEVFMPKFNMDSARKIMRRDLKSFFGIEGSVEKRKVECLILYRLSENHKFGTKNKDLPPIYDKSSSEIIFKNVSFALVVNKLKEAHYGLNDPIIIDETGIDPEMKVDISLKTGSFHFNKQLRDELRKYGLGIKLDKRAVDVLVLKAVR